MSATLLKMAWPFVWNKDRFRQDAPASSTTGRQRIRSAGPAAGVTVTEASAAAWTEFGTADPGQALSSSGTTTYMTVTLNGTTEVQSERIVIKNFGHRLPQNATVNKIEVQYAIRSSATAGYDSEVFLTKDGTNPASVNLAERETASAAFASVLRTDGALAGITWTPQEVNDETFGVILRVASAVADQIDLNAFRVIVYYEPPLVVRPRGVFGVRHGRVGGRR